MILGCLDGEVCWLMFFNRQGGQRVAVKGGPGARGHERSEPALYSHPLAAYAFS